MSSEPGCSNGKEMVALLEGPPEWHDGEIVYP
jgi:hypothetical protein